MRLLVELSGEQPALARAEALAAIEASGVSSRVLLAEDRLLAVESDVDPRWLGGRLALAHFVDELVAWGSLDETLAAANAMDLGNRTFRVRVNSFKGCHNKAELEKRVGGLVRGPVDLSDPQEEVRLIEGEQHYLCRRLAAIDRSAYEKRKVAERPFFFPISLHPRLARALVNLARVPQGGTILDPFCGTGGVLLEAGMIRARAFGGDVREDMVEGCRGMLAQFGLAAELYVGDVGTIAGRFTDLDAVAMDPPYGRATTTKGEGLVPLYERAFRAAATCVKRGGYVTAILPATVPFPHAESLELVESYSLRVHKTLTRSFVVTRRAG